jgi:hypothetical protein
LLAMGNGNCCEHRNEPGTLAEESTRRPCKWARFSSTDEAEPTDEAEHVSNHTSVVPEFRATRLGLVEVT